MIQITLGVHDSRRLRRSALRILLLGFALWLAYVVRDIWIPLLIAFLIALVLDPLVDRMEQRGWSRLKGTITIYVLFFGVLGGSVAASIPSLIGQTEAVAGAIGQYLPSESDTDTKRSLMRLLQHAHATPFVESAVLRASSQISRSVGNTGSWIGKMAQGVMTNLLWALLIPVVSFYALKDFHLILARLLMLLPAEDREMTQRFVNEVTGIFVGYLRGLVVVCALNAVATATALALFRIPNALALGTIAGALYVIPYLGPVLTVALIGGFALISTTVQMTMIVILAMIVLHSVIFDQIVTPRVLGHHVGLHPLLSIIALLIGGSLLGILGMILAVPVAATIQMLLRALYPKLEQPINVPVGEQIQGRSGEIAGQGAGDDEIASASSAAHHSIVEAVDTADPDTPTPAHVL